MTEDEMAGWHQPSINMSKLGETVKDTEAWSTRWQRAGHNLVLTLANQH